MFSRYFFGIALLLVSCLATAAVPAIDSDDGRTLALAGDGSLFTWGYSNAGLPSRITGLSDVVAISAGNDHFSALKSDGTVWSSHFVASSTGKYYAPGEFAQVAGLSGITAISEGGDYRVALKNDGSVWEWGYYFTGDAVPIAGLSGVRAIYSSGTISLALATDNTVLSWSGNKPSGGTGGRTAPALVTGLSDVTAFSADESGGIRYAVKSDGTVWRWTASSAPRTISGLTNVKNISANYGMALALKNDGTVWAWGYNSKGELGDGTTTTRTAPVQVLGLTDIVAISAGGMFEASAALQRDGTVWTWGDNSAGQIGNKGTNPYYSTPVQPYNSITATALNLGAVSVAKVSDSDRLFNWAESAFPTLFSPIAPPSQSASGYYFRNYATTRSYLATKDGHVFYLTPLGALLDVGLVADFLPKAQAAGF